MAPVQFHRWPSTRLSRTSIDGSYGTCLFLGQPPSRLPTRVPWEDKPLLMQELTDKERSKRQGGIADGIVGAQHSLKHNSAAKKQNSLPVPVFLPLDINPRGLKGIKNPFGFKLGRGRVSLPVIAPPQTHHEHEFDCDDIFQAERSRLPSTFSVWNPSRRDHLERKEYDLRDGGQP
ncbi:uncharacterized protein BDZ99DRAFT_514065 [Mytilinidion resinicola]|uniref:Uncharacterized protein n=1 Tax=Mytilinidion resinicola TaxID=574789 RepID=A0A6A6Z9P8_9PEZI|nr:uncharacterized protein BDZ99DRAFT_514065 [Mytilinidion resinicola]KAF2817851.1 hypothetical protein BDZ99DRAFT_514065 [Mytilinidion resinicola]